MGRLASLLAFLALALASRNLQPLRGYFAVLLAILIADEFLRPLVATTTIWPGWFGEQRGLFWSSLGTQLLRLLMTLAAWIVLDLKGMKRTAYFLVKGQLDSPAEPVRWLDIKPGQPWTLVGKQFVLAFSLVFLIVPILANWPILGAFGKVLPWLPVVLLFASLNAFNENFICRAAPLSQLMPALGKQHSLLLTTAYFGLWHFYGVPSGLIGVLLPSFLGWVLGKVMLETFGFQLPPG